MEDQGWGVVRRGEVGELKVESEHCQVKGAALAAANYAPGKRLGWGVRRGDGEYIYVWPATAKGASEVFLTSRSSPRQVVC